MPELRFWKLAVIGDPIEHSRSPDLQRSFLKAAGIPGTYEAIRVPAGDGARAIDDLRAGDYNGLNVTTPLKEEAFARADWRDSTALASGSVNTLVFADAIEGHNTDGIGALGALYDAGLRDLVGARILVLGAGPTARAVAAALHAADAVVWVWNRTPERAVAVAHELGAYIFAPSIRYDAAFAALSPGAVPADLEVTKAVRAAAVLVDANYGVRATLARALGRTGVDGSSMLEHSARASFTLWRAALGMTTSG